MLELLFSKEWFFCICSETSCLWACENLFNTLYKRCSFYSIMDIDHIWISVCPMCIASCSNDIEMPTSHSESLPMILSCLDLIWSGIACVSSHATHCVLDNLGIRNWTPHLVQVLNSLFATVHLVTLAFGFNFSGFTTVELLINVVLTPVQ